MKQTKILILEDDTPFGVMLRGWLERSGYSAVLCCRVADARSELQGSTYAVVLSDLRLPDGDGLELLQWMREQKMDTPVIVMSSYGEVSTAVAAMKFGAKDFLEKPVVPSLLKDKIEAIISAPVARDKPEKKPHTESISGKSIAAQVMYDHILKVAPTRMSVLILGESGTGKEYAARMIHNNSPRADRAFVAVDCGSLSRELAASELFGHLKGAFTTAIADKKGFFETANSGTIFLDEVGNLSYEVQVQLLRALQERKIRPVGSAQDIEIDVRIVSATNENIEEAIAEGRFREDLYHRLCEFTLSVPPLRERKGDIAIFAAEFLRQANRELERSIKGFSHEASKMLEDHRWSGNLRELRNVVRRAALFATGDEICKADLPTFAPAPRTNPTDDNYTLRRENEQQHIENALYRARGNKTLAAQLLKIDRKTLYNKIHQYGIKL